MAKKVIKEKSLAVAKVIKAFNESFFKDHKHIQGQGWIKDYHKDLKPEEFNQISEKFITSVSAENSRTTRAAIEGINSITAGQSGLRFKVGVEQLETLINHPIVITIERMLRSKMPLEHYLSYIHEQRLQKGKLDSLFIFGDEYQKRSVSMSLKKEFLQQIEEYSKIYDLDRNFEELQKDPAFVIAAVDFANEHFLKAKNGIIQGVLVNTNQVNPLVKTLSELISQEIQVRGHKKASLALVKAQGQYNYAVSKTPTQQIDGKVSLVNDVSKENIYRCEADVGAAINRDMLAEDIGYELIKPSIRRSFPEVEIAYGLAKQRVKQECDDLRERVQDIDDQYSILLKIIGTGSFAEKLIESLILLDLKKFKEENFKALIQDTITLFNSSGHNPYNKTAAEKIDFDKRHANMELYSAKLEFDASNFGTRPDNQVSRDKPMGLFLGELHPGYNLYDVKFVSRLLGLHEFLCENNPDFVKAGITPEALALTIFNHLNDISYKLKKLQELYKHDVIGLHGPNLYYSFTGGKYLKLNYMENMLTVFKRFSDNKIINSHDLAARELAKWFIQEALLARVTWQVTQAEDSLSDLMDLLEMEF